MNAIIDHREAETQMLGACLLRPTGIDDVADVITPDDLYAPKHTIIWAAILQLHRTGDAVDAITVGNHLTRTGELATIGGLPYLHQLINGVVTTTNAQFYARIVHEQAVLRRLAAAGTRITQLAQAGEGDVTALVETCRAEVDAVATGTAAVSTGFIGDTIDTTLEALETEPTGYPTPWPDLNRLIRVWRPGALYVVGARPAVGKSIVGVQAAVHLAQHGAVVIASLEMPRVEVEQRILAHLARVPGNRIDAHDLTDEDWARIARHRAELASLPIAIDDRSSLTPAGIRAFARTVAHRRPLAGIVVDYLQLMTAPRGMEKRNRAEVVGEFSRGLKLLAKELQVPVIALSQLNRGPEQRQDKRPSMADLRESGAVEQDSDVVLLLHEHDDDETALDMLVAKNRQGQCGVVELTRGGAFSEMTPRQWRPAPVPVQDREPSWHDR